MHRRLIVRRLVSFLPLIALVTVDNAEAGSQAFSVSTGYNETALTSDLNRGTEFQGEVARGHMLYVGSLDSRGLGSLGIGLITSATDIDVRTSRYPVLTVFARPGEASGVALDLHQDWYWRGTPTARPDKHVTMFQMQGGVVFQEGHSPKVRVTQRFVTSERRFPARSQGVEWVWEFRRDYPAVYSAVSTNNEMTPLARRTMRLENWIFFTREVGFAVMRLNIGATYKNETEPAGGASATPASPTPGSQTRRVPVLMCRLGLEVRRW
jgi:hypothetical protein